MTFDSGVSRYVTGTAIIKVPFPVDHKGNVDICCNQCRYYRSRRCNLTEEICNYPNYGPADSCPLSFEEEIT